MGVRVVSGGPGRKGDDMQKVAIASAPVPALALFAPAMGQNDFGGGGALPPPEVGAD